MARMHEDCMQTAAMAVQRHPLGVLQGRHGAKQAHHGIIAGIHTLLQVQVILQGWEAAAGLLPCQQQQRQAEPVQHSPPHAPHTFCTALTMSG